MTDPRLIAVLDKALKEPVTIDLEDDKAARAMRERFYRYTRAQAAFGVHTYDGLSFCCAGCSLIVEPPYDELAALDAVLD